MQPGADTGSPCTAGSATITVVTRTNESEVIETLGARPKTHVEKTFHEAEDLWSDDVHPVQVWAAQAKTLIVEPNGFQCSLLPTLQQLARLGEAVSVYWNIGAGNQIAVAHRGLTIRRFDPLLDADGDGESLTLPEEKGLPFGVNSDDATPASLVFLERRSGFRATADAILKRKRPTYRQGTQRALRETAEPSVA